MRLVLELAHCLPSTRALYPAGAAVNVIDGHTTSSSAGYGLVGAVLDLGTTVDPRTLRRVVVTKDDAMIEILLHHGLQRHLHQWTNNRFLHAAFAILASASLVRITTQSQTYGFDFTEARYECAPEVRWYWQPKDHPPRLIDIAASRGDIPVVRVLLDYGSATTPDTVVAAVSSLNADLVSLLLQRQPTANAFSTHYYTTPFAESVRLGHLEQFSMLGKLDHSGDDRNASVALLVAASGHIDTIRRLIPPQSPCSAEIMGSALSRAVMADQTASAIRLLEAGASTDSDRFTKDQSVFPSHNIASGWNELEEMRPLRAAVLHQNKTLVYKLLEHNVCWSDCLALAVKWGDREIISDLLFARSGLPSFGFMSRADEAGAVAAAVRARDLALLRQCLENGLCAEADTVRYQDSATAAAVQLGETEMVRLIVAFWPLELSAAFTCCVEHDRLEILQMLEHKIRNAHAQEIGRRTRHALCVAIRQ
ncbi:hypothetical protein TI39_contig497g00004 [Zymoseptoria brevis]|uniref:Uncharacterized protein n=1 Tax=Zymoseptoria brevis TaxID=1047168 RepID=A0A0F4GK05_9PEZI|nr:hypothetical protein TI39_contig497g00004 [Zymoseptoria brevis]